MDTSDVIIIGAGMVGSCMALSCAQQGLRVILLDKQPPSPITLDTHLRVSNINISSERFLNQLGVVFPKDRCGIFKHIQVFQENILSTLEFDAKLLGQSYLGSIIENNVLISLIHQQLQHYSHVQYDFGIALENVQLTEDAALLYAQHKTFSAPLIIGAEGAQSWLRQQCKIAQQEKSYQQTALVTHIKTQKPHQHTAYQRFLQNGPLAYLPLNAVDQCSIVWSSTPEHIEYLTKLDDQTLASEIAKAMMHTLGEVELISARASFPLWMRHAKHYIAPRVALIGDAIHTIHPLAGQGANLGLMDVASLRRALDFAKMHQRDIGSYAILRRFERERRLPNTLMLRAVQWLAENQMLMPTLRGLGIRVAQQSNLLKKIMMQFVNE